MNALGKQMFKCQEARWSDVVTIDPGLGGTGLAFWTELRHIDDGETAITPFDFSLAWRRGNGDWHNRLRQRTDDAMSVIDIWKVRTIVLEMPCLWTGSAKSQGSAASGKLFKLSALTGAIIYAARCRGIPVAEVYPDEWKGQLDDRLVHKRIAEKLGLRYPTHVHDAVGMGLAIQGVLCSNPR